MVRPSPADVEHAVRVIAEIAARYGERQRGARHHVRPGGAAGGGSADALSGWIDREEEALFKIVRAVEAFDQTIGVASLRGTRITRRDLWTAAFADDLYALVTRLAGKKPPVDDLRRLLELHGMEIGRATFAALREALAPDAVYEAGGARKATRKAVARMMGREGEARGEIVIANAQAVLKTGAGAAAALDHRRWSARKTLRYVARIVGAG